MTQLHTLRTAGLMAALAILLAGCGKKFPPPSQWETGRQPAAEGEWQGEKSISWLQSFKLPEEKQVIAYLEKSGMKIGKVEPVSYEDNDETRKITYQVRAMVPTRLYRMSSRPWDPKEKELARFGKVLVFNPGLPPGQAWDADDAKVASEQGQKFVFTWSIVQDKTYNMTTAERLVFGDGLFTQQQVADARAETARAISGLQSSIADINRRVEDFKKSESASIPGDPPKPELLSRKWGGSGSGEPTKTAVRGVGGAAGGAAIGGLAGGGDGAAIGAGAGFLGGLIYDGVSKSNDREEFEKKVDAENNARLADWKAKKKALAARRSEVNQRAKAMKQELLSQLEADIVANSGRLPGTGPVSRTPAGQPPADAPAKIEM